MMVLVLQVRWGGEVGWVTREVDEIYHANREKT